MTDEFEYIQGQHSQYFIDKINLVGVGGNSTVYMCYDINCPNNQYCAKVMSRDKNDNNLIKSEILTLQKLQNEDCQYFVQCADYFMNEQAIYIVMEYCNGGDFWDLLQSRQFFLEEEALDYLLQILKGLQIMHKNEIYHRDIKPENIMVQDFMFLKLADFGHSKHVENMQVTVNLSKNLGTTVYNAPEAHKGGHSHGGKIDVWAAGMIAYYLFYGFTDAKIEDFYQRLEDYKRGQGTRPLLLPQNIIIPDICQKLIFGMLQYNYQDRLNCYEAIEIIEEYLVSKEEDTSYDVSEKSNMNTQQIQKKCLKIGDCLGINAIESKKKSRQFLNQMTLSLSKIIPKINFDKQILQEKSWLVKKRYQEIKSASLIAKEKSQKFLQILCRLQIEIQFAKLLRTTAEHLLELINQFEFIQNQSTIILSLYLTESNRLTQIEQQFDNNIEIDNNKQEIQNYLLNEIEKEKRICETDLSNLVEIFSQKDLKDAQQSNNQTYQNKIITLLKVLINALNNFESEPAIKSNLITLIRLLIACYDLQGEQFFLYQNNPFAYFNDIYSTIIVLNQEQPDGSLMMKHIQALLSNFSSLAPLQKLFL